MDIKQWILNNIPNNGIVIEAGTADGYDTDFFSRILSNGKVYGFEPIPKLYQNTLLKVGNRSNTKILNYALSETTSKFKMSVSDRFGSEWGSSSILKPKDHLTFHTEITFKEEIDVNGINLDEFVKNENISNIDLLWLDMQGYEPIVLKSSPNALKMTKYLYTEVSLIETYEGVVLWPEYKEWLLNNNFEIIEEDLPWKDMGNVLLKNKLFI